MAFLLTYQQVIRQTFKRQTFSGLTSVFSILKWLLSNLDFLIED
jgi:hypothetical protein